MFEFIFEYCGLDQVAMVQLVAGKDRESAIIFGGKLTMDMTKSSHEKHQEMIDWINCGLIKRAESISKLNIKYLRQEQAV